MMNQPRKLHTPEQNHNLQQNSMLNIPIKLKNRKESKGQIFEAIK